MIPPQRRQEETAIQIIVPVLDAADEAAALRDVAGLPLIRRVLLGAAKAGFGEAAVLVRGDSSRIRQVLAGAHAEIVAPDAWAEALSSTPVLVVAPDFLPDRALFDHLRTSPVPDRPRVFGERAVWCRPGQLVEALGRQRPHAMALLAELKGTQAATDGSCGSRITDDADARRAESALLGALIKDTEGFLSRHINRRISLAVTRQLMHTPVTPNQMTWVSMLIGLAGAALFLLPARGAQVLGAALFLLHSILDGCDGELARLKFMESRFGGVFDFWSDNVVHVAVFASIGAGLALHQGAVWPLWLGTAAVAGTLTSAWLVFDHTMRSHPANGPLYTSVSTAESKSTVVRIADMLSRRDFIYLVLILAMFGELQWFLIAAGIGAPLYALVLAGIVWRDVRNAG